MPSCAAVGCSNRSDKFLMKAFPRDQKRRKLWAMKVKRLNWEPTNTSCLCEVHFEPEQWEKTRIDGKRKLKCNAVPTLFKHAMPKPNGKILVPEARLAVKKEMVESTITIDQGTSDSQPEIRQEPMVLFNNLPVLEDKDKIIKELEEKLQLEYSQKLIQEKIIKDLNRTKR